MADTVGSAEFIVKIKDMITGPMKSIGANISGTLKSIGVVAAGNILSAGIMRAVDAAKGFVSQGLAANAQFDQLNNTFTSMLGSQRKATALMGDLQKFAAKTPFEMPGLSEAATMLLGTQRIGEQQVIPMLKKLGDAAAGSSKGFQSMDRVVWAISQMLGKGKLQTEEMNQLAEAGIPAWSALAKKMGLSTAEVQKLAQQGKLGVNEIMLLVDGLGDKYKGLAEKQSKTFAGLQSTISDNMNMALAKITRPIYESMTKVMAKIAAIMDSKAFAAVVDGLTAGVSHLVSMFDAAVDAAGKFITSIQQSFANPATGSFAEKLIQIWGLIQEIGSNLRDAILPVVQQIATRAMSAFGAIKAGFGSFLSTALDGLRSVLDFLSIITADFGKTWEFVQLKAAATFSYISDVMRHVFMEEAPNMMTALSEAIFESIDQTILALYKIIPAALQMGVEINSAIMGLLGNIATAMIEVNTQMGHIAIAIAENFQSAFWSLAKFVGTIFGAMFDDLFRRSQYMVEAMKALASADSRKAFSFAKLAAGGDGEFGKKTVAAGRKFADENADLLGKIGDRAAKIGDIFKEKILGGADKFRQQLEASGGKFGGTLGNAVFEGSKKVADLFNSIRSTVPGFAKSRNTTMLEGMAGGKWQEMLWARNKSRWDKMIAGFGMKNFPGLLGKGIADAVVGGGNLLEDGFGGLMEMFHKDPGEEKKAEKKKAQTEFVGYAEMNKRIQMMLGKEDKDKKAALKAQQQAAAAGQKNVEQGGKLIEVAAGIKGGIEKMFMGFGN